MADEDQQNETPASLREAADEGRRARAEAAALQRENAFLRAGVDLDSPLGKMFGKAYDGELTREAIQEAAKEVGAIRTAETAASPPPEPQHDTTQSQDRMDLASGSTVPDPNLANPYQEAERAWDAARADGATREAAAAAPLAVLLEAAHRGDSRVILER
jgi:hypothetical protein